MRILQVITTLQFGGAEKLISEIAPLLRDKGNIVDVCSFSAAGQNLNNVLESQGIKVINFVKNGSVYNPSFVLKLIKLMRNYDIVHTHNTSPQLFAAIAKLWNKKCKLVTTEHNTNNRRRTWKWYVPLDRWMYKQYDKIICISDTAKKNLLDFHPSLNNVCTIYNGVNVNKFYEAKPKEELRPSGKTIVVMVAAYRPQKDHKTLIDALKYLPEDKYELWLVGDGEIRDEIESYANAAGGNNIRFLGNRTDVPEILHTADIIVMSSHYEGLSLSSVEGMSVGKPFIASDVDGLREIVKDYGVLVPHQDALALANEIKKLTEDHAYSLQVADRCWERAQQYDIQKTVDGYEKVYEELMETQSVV